MILGAEIALLAIGLYALIMGRLPTNKKSKHVVQGLPARLIGAIGLLPLPLSLAVGTAMGLLLVFLKKEITPQTLFWTGTAAEGAIVLVCAITMNVLSRIYRTPIVRSSTTASSPDEPQP